MRRVLIQIYYQVVLASKNDSTSIDFLLCIIALIKNICITMKIWYDKSQNYYQKVGEKAKQTCKRLSVLKIIYAYKVISCCANM